MPRIAEYAVALAIEKMLWRDVDHLLLADHRGSAASRRHFTTRINALASRQ